VIDEVAVMRSPSKKNKSEYTLQTDNSEDFSFELSFLQPN